ncbi:hypothetical protein [Pelagicoccus sp. SDUM812005]|uniref:hypothetical protein n=1 Tax=Pelagicoccus sp. SDUM812005 TaxID=3041257 RepID=UPI00281282A6|nr:hypothetical protein [Pelagicoccus sp. SDUM812005]
MSVGGKQRWINLKTSDPDLAVLAARKKLLVGPSLKVEDVDFSPATVAQYLAAFKALGTLPPKTYRDYRNRVLRVVAWIKGIEVPIATRGPRRIAFEREVGAVRLLMIKERDLMAWRERQVELCRRDAKDRLSPRTANGSIAAWWAVFRKSSLWPLFGLTSFPGLGMKKLSAKKVIFRTLVPLQGLIDKAKQELREQDPDCYDLFLLATALGLRLKEADMLLWSAFNFDRKILDLKASVLYGYKSYQSEGEVKIYSDKVLDHFRSRFENRAGDFVLKSERPAGEDKDTTYYRCEPTSDRLKAWLRSHGVVCDKPIHYLRGTGGNQVRIDNDIFAAQCFLRHASVQTTIEFYSEVDTSYSTTLEF